MFAGIVAIAFLIRWFYLNQIKDNPFFVPIDAGLDDYFYDTWAKGIAQGDVLGKEVFYGLPLYPYFLGFLYFIFGHNLFIVKAIQLFIGSLSCGLTYLVGARIFNRMVGIMAAAVLSFYAMSIYLEGLFVSVFLTIFLNLMALLLLLSTAAKPSWPKWLCAGFLIGLSALTNASMLLFVPFLIFWIFTAFKDISHPRRAGYSLLLVLAVSVIIGIVALRNYIVGKDFVPITAHSGITFYAGNNPLSKGFYRLPMSIGDNVIDSKENARIFAEKAENRKLKPSEVSKHWFNQGLEFITKEPRVFSSSLLKKAYLFWNGNELPDILPLYFFKRYSSILRFPLFNFMVISPLALFGMFLCIRCKRQGVHLLYLYVASIFLSTIIFFVNERYRLSVIPVLCIFSASVIYWCYLTVMKKKWVNIAIFVSGVFSIFIIISIPVYDYKTASQPYNMLAVILQKKGLYQEAINEYKKAIESNPRHPFIYFNLGTLYFKRGNYREAIENYKKALSVNSNFIDAHNAVAKAYFNIGERDKALLHLKRSFELNPDQTEIKELLNSH